MSSSNNGKNTAIAILSALLLFLAGAAIWLLFNNKSQVKENQETLGKISSIQNQLTDLESDNAKLIVELDTKGSDNDMLRGEVESLRFQLEEAKSMLKNLSTRAIKSPGSVSNQEIESARNMIRELVAQRDKFLASLDSVSSLTQSYSQQAQVVTVEKEKLQTIITQERALHEVEMKKIENQNVSLLSENVNIKKQLKVSSSLGATNFKPVLQGEKKGKRFVTSKTSKAVGMLVCYDIVPNIAAEMGEQSNVIRIIDPSGTLLYDQKNGSGTFTDTKGNEVKYSKEKRFDYNGKAENVCVDWTGPLEPGMYKTEVYDNDHKVAESEFELK